MPGIYIREMEGVYLSRQWIEERLEGERKDLAGIVLQILEQNSFEDMLSFMHKHNVLTGRIQIFEMVHGMCGEEEN